MKKLKSIFLIVFLILLIVGIAIVATYVYYDQLKKTEVFREYSPNDAFEVVVFQVGSPKWPFGPVKAQIKLYNSNGKIVVKTDAFWVDTDGAPLFDSMIEQVSWHDKVVDMTLWGENQPQTHTLQAGAKTTYDIPEPQPETEIIYAPENFEYHSIDDEFAQKVAASLNVPDKENLTYTVSESFYWTAAQRNCVQIDFFEDGNLVAGAIVDDKTGELMRNIHKYTVR